MVIYGRPSSRVLLELQSMGLYFSFSILFFIYLRLEFSRCHDYNYYMMCHIGHMTHDTLTVIVTWSHCHNEI